MDVHKGQTDRQTDKQKDRQKERKRVIESVKDEETVLMVAMVYNERIKWVKVGQVKRLEKQHGE